MPGSPASRVIEHMRQTVLRCDGGGLTDGQLLQCFVERRDGGAFEALVRRHGPMVWGVCRRMLADHHDAEDAFQATFLVLVRRAAAVVPREAVGNFLYGVACHTARKVRAAAAKRGAREKQVPVMPEPETRRHDPSRDLEAALDEELSRLPDKYRLPIVLCDLEGRTRKEVAAQLRLPEGTLSSRLTTARRMLAKRLRRGGLALSAGAVAAVLSRSAAAAAPVPGAVLSVTIRAAGLAAAGKATPGVISAKVTALTEGVLRAMVLTKLKVTTALLLGIAVGAAVAGGLLYHPLGASEPRSGRPAARAPGAADPPPARPGERTDRAEELKAIEAQYRAERASILEGVRAGKIQEKDGRVPELAELQKRVAGRVRRLIGADPKDAVALDAILFSMQDLVADEHDPKLYDLLLAHHLGSPRLGGVVGRFYAEEPFLRKLIAGSPHAEVRARATLALAARLVRHNRPAEAEPLLEEIVRDKEWAALNHHHGNLGKGAEDLLFEIRCLSVGKTAPEIDSFDMDDKPLKLSEYRGKVVLLVFWATWCGPCMAMVPHEVELAKRYADRPFAVVGVNGDGDIVFGPKGEQIDQKSKVREIVKRKGIAWRSFRDYLPKEKVQLSRRWNVDGWPTVYLLDHRGTIRHKFLGVPARDDLDAAVANLVAAAEADRNK
jgi:RNA polymerase sigma factor (sigma-70 family)